MLFFIHQAFNCFLKQELKEYFSCIWHFLDFWADEQTKIRPWAKETEASGKIGTGFAVSRHQK